MREIGIRELRDIARGAAVLGTGGGGDPYIGRLLAERAIADHGPVQLVDVSEVPDDALVLPSAMMGAPTVMVEKLPRGGEAASALRALETRLGRAATHTVSIEAGGLNSTIPFAVAAELGLPVVDADAMGRAFPELQMVLPTLVGIDATPMALADEKGNSVVFDTLDNHWAERLARSATIDMGCTAMLSLYALPGARLEDALVSGTLSLCEELGRLIASERAAHGDPVGAVSERLGGRVLLTGKVVDVARRTQDGFARGEAEIEGLGGDAGAALTLYFQNEHLLARLDGEVAAVTPDLIMVLDAETGEPVTTEGLRYGQRIAALAAPCDSRWRTPEGLALVGPEVFGYGCEYVPVEGEPACAS
jgi:DUF917 family protein